jgi:hypothetical protein
LEDASSYELFSDVMNLNEQQRRYVRTLGSGHAVVRSPNGHPVHIKIPNVKDQITEQSPIADADIASYMSQRRKDENLLLTNVIEWQTSLAAGENQTDETKSVNRRDLAETLLRAPLQTCVHCKPLLLEGRCPHRSRVLNMIDKDIEDTHLIPISQILHIEDSELRWQEIISWAIIVDEHEHGNQAYCYFAHLADMIRALPDVDETLAKRLRIGFRELLNEFDAMYAIE